MFLVSESDVTGVITTVNVRDESVCKGARHLPGAAPRRRELNTRPDKV